MTDSWTIVEQSITGDIQYIIATYDQTITAGLTTIALSVEGYTSGTIAGTGAAPTSELIIEGSNDGLSWFRLSKAETFNATAPLINYDVWGRAVKEIRLGAVINDITGIYLLAIAGGSGILVSTAGSTHAPGSNKEIIFNDGGQFAGTTGVLYDKTANTNTGQVQLAAGSEEEPMLSFSRGTFPAGAFDSGIHRPGNNVIAFSVHDTDMVAITNSSVLSLTPGLNVDTPGVAGAPGHAIKRLGNLTAGVAGDASWEDGFFGDSEKMIFTASDFSCENVDAGRTPTTSSIPILSAIGRGGTPYPVLIVAAGNAAPPGGGSDGVRIVATKIIPQGFTVPTEQPITVYSPIGATGLGGVLTCTLEAYFGDLNDASATFPTSLRLPTVATLGNWTAGGICEDYVISVEAPQQPQGGGGGVTEPQGRRTIMLVITVTNIAVALDNTNGLAGVSVPIQRMP